MLTILKSNNNRRISNILFIFFLLIASLPYTYITKLCPENELQTYVIPFLWCLLCILYILFIPRIHPIGRYRLRQGLLFDTIICAGILLAVRLLAGYFIDDFGTTPYDLSPLGILMNLYRMAPRLIAFELVRYHYLSTYCRKRINLFFFIVSILLAIAAVNMKEIALIDSKEAMVKFMACSLGAEICISILMSYISLHGGARAAIIYIAILKLFYIAFPVLPNLQWFTEGVINISIPVVEVLYFTSKYDQKKIMDYKSKPNLLSMSSLIATCSFSIAFLWFVVGVFPIYPHVIATGSMRPLIYEGDVILIDKITEERELYNLHEGDVIQFTRDDILITHRITQIVKSKDGKVSYQTKGDNNSVEDQKLVEMEDVKGTLYKVIPKLGTITLWLKTSKENEPEGVTN